MNKFVTIVICLLLAEPLKRVFLTLTIICRYNKHTVSLFAATVNAM